MLLGHIEEIFIKDVAQSKGIGKQLLDQVKKVKSTLKLNVFLKNERAIQFYLRRQHQAGEKLFSEYDQITKNYTCKKEGVYTEIVLPTNAPPKYADRATLWNSVEEIEIFKLKIFCAFSVLHLDETLPKGACIFLTVASAPASAGKFSLAFSADFCYKIFIISQRTHERIMPLAGSSPAGIIRFLLGKKEKSCVTPKTL